MGDTAQINPRVLAWARETAGLSVEEAADKLGLKDSAKASAVEKLQMLELGELRPGQTTLQKAVTAYRRPLIAFYMAEPPARGERGEDFRAKAGTAVSPRDNATLDALVRDVRARQQMLRQALEDEEEAEPLPFVGSAKIENGARRVAAGIRDVLKVTIEQQKRSKDPAALFAALRSAAEAAGIYVLLLGDVGSHHSDIGEDVFRGFALADEEAPFVVINDNDAAAARPFTLMHELAHIWLGASGVSGPLRQMPENVIERFCNDVAGEFLLPVGGIPDLSGELKVADRETVMRAVARVAETWSVSEPAVAYRFARDGWINSGTASELFALFAERWRRRRDRERDVAERTGPTFYPLRRYRLGARLINVVRRALQAETLTHTRAAKILGVGPASVMSLLNYERARAK